MKKHLRRSRKRKPVAATGGVTARSVCYTLVAALLAILLVGGVAGAGGQWEGADSAPARLDVDIQTAVRGRLQSLFGTEAARVLVSVEEGQVVLKGVIPSHALRRSMEEEVLGVPGVMSVENQLVVFAPVASPSVQGPESRVRAVLELSPVLATRDLQVQARAGVVTLSGVVGTAWEKQRAGRLSSQVVGVLEVVNELVVVPTEGPTDERIARAIAAAIERNREVHLQGLDIRVESGTVYLGGHLAAYSSHESLLEIVQVPEGVTEVVDKTTIASPPRASAWISRSKAWFETNCAGTPGWTKQT